MRTEFDRQAQVRALIPKGPSAAQAVFRDATALAYAQGLSIESAVEFGTEQARRTEPHFSPEYDVALLVIDST